MVAKGPEATRVVGQVETRPVVSSRRGSGSWPARWDERRGMASANAAGQKSGDFDKQSRSAMYRYWSAWPGDRSRTRWSARSVRGSVKQSKKAAIGSKLGPVERRQLIHKCDNGRQSKCRQAEGRKRQARFGRRNRGSSFEEADARTLI